MIFKTDQCNFIQRLSILALVIKNKIMNIIYLRFDEHPFICYYLSLAPMDLLSVSLNMEYIFTGRKKTLFIFIYTYVPRKLWSLLIWRVSVAPSEHSAIFLAQSWGACPRGSWLSQVYLISVENITNVTLYSFIMIFLSR